MLNRVSLRIPGPIFLSILCLSSASLAQDLSPEQAEVWQFINECNERYFNEDEAGILDCYHNDFIGWRYGDPVPRTKDTLRSFLPSELETTEPVAYDLRPIAIRVFGDVAIIHYSIKWREELADGSLGTTDMIWTDTALREGNRWRWIGDHGGAITAD